MLLVLIAMLPMKIISLLMSLLISSGKYHEMSDERAGALSLQVPRYT